MKIRDTFLMLVLVLLAMGGPAAAQDEPANDDPAEDFVLEEGEEVVHSWALTPGGAAEGAGGNRNTLSYAGDPGTVIEDAVTLFNLGNQILTFRLYATDAVNAAGGEFALLPADATPSGVGSWVTFTQELVTVEPGTAATIPITVTIPEDASPGDHSGGVLAANEAFTTAEDGGTIIVERRTGSRLLLRVNGPLRPELAVTNLEVDYNTNANPFSGSTSFSYDLENRGNVRLDATADVSVAGPFGIGRTSIAARDFADVLPGQTIQVTGEVDGVAALMLATARVELSAGDDNDGLTVQPVTREATTFAPPITLVLLALMVIFGAFAVRAYRRHDREPVEAVIDVGESAPTETDAEVEELV